MNFGFFVPKMAVSWRTSAFQKNSAWNPYVYSGFLGARFLGQGVKKGKFWKPTKKRKIVTNNW